MGPEQVDDHQIAFVRKMAEQGEVRLAERREELWTLLDRAVNEPAAFRTPARRGSADHTVTRFGELVDDLLGLGPVAEREWPTPDRASPSEQGIRLSNGVPDEGLIDPGAFLRPPTPPLDHAVQPFNVAVGTLPGGLPTRQAGVLWPRVSVLVPTRDRPELLRRAVRAVLQQRYPGEIECLVVFDQSEPAPLALGPGERRTIRAVRNDRTPGLAGARNAGALAAHGELLAFCDDDDIWHPDKLRKQVQLLEARPDATAVGCGTVVRYGDRSIARPVGRVPVTFRDLLRSRRMEIHPSSVTLRRAQFLNEIGLVDEALPGSYAEDYEWLLRAARCGPIVAVPEPLVTISWNHSSYFAGRWETIAQALRYLLDRYPEFRTVPRGLARVQGQIAFALAASGRRREALAWAQRSLVSSPMEPRGYLAVAVAAGLVSPEGLLHLAHRFGKGI
jgi:glycosyltransferase involved in cell wall biosynthesis